MIGLFDSGFGGLTIQAALLKDLPQYSYIYLGDNANAPYGPKGDEEIYNLTRNGVQHLFELGAPLVILACNTASASALRRLQNEWLPYKYPINKVLGVIAPTVEKISGAPWNQVEPINTINNDTIMHIGVLATEHTVKTNAYRREVNKRNSSIEVIQQACPGLAEAIEQNQEEKVHKLVYLYVKALRKQFERKRIPIDAVLLGCTHYQFIADKISEFLPPTTHVFNQPNIISQSLNSYLLTHPKLEKRISISRERIYFTTSSKSHLSSIYKKLFNHPIEFKQL